MDGSDARLRSQISKVVRELAHDKQRAEGVSQVVVEVAAAAAVAGSSAAGASGRVRYGHVRWGGMMAASATTWWGRWARGCHRR